MLCPITLSGRETVGSKVVERTATPARAHDRVISPKSSRSSTASVKPFLWGRQSFRPWSCQQFFSMRHSSMLPSLLITYLSSHSCFESPGQLESVFHLRPMIHTRHTSHHLYMWILPWSGCAAQSRKADKVQTINSFLKNETKSLHKTLAHVGYCCWWCPLGVSKSRVT